LENQPAGTLRKNTYLQRYAHPERLINEEPENGISIIVTIPAYDEPATEKALLSLSSCTLPQEGAAEVLVLINHPQNDEDEVKSRSERSFEQLQKVARQYSKDSFKIHILYKALPVKHAGVGRARKILMDEAVRRFELINNEKGVITAFDADCTCSSNYFVAIDRFFKLNPKASGCSVYFEHPAHAEASDDVIIHAALEYELHLRCYIDALRWCGIPHAFQTIGSSMAVNHLAYQRQGGMNSRKAGEDFYFLHRIIREGNFGDLTSTTVIPSPRMSERVPFGTGKAVIKWMESGEQMTYNIQSYIFLKELINLVDVIYDFQYKQEEDILYQLKLAPVVTAFLHEVNFSKELRRLFTSSSTLPLFRKHFFQWFDGFKIMKYLHYLRDNGYPDLPVNMAAAEIREYLSSNNDKQKDLLSWYREYDKGHPRYLKY
jgi:hypothetical protein